MIPDKKRAVSALQQAVKAGDEAAVKTHGAVPTVIVKQGKKRFGKLWRR